MIQARRKTQPFDRVRDLGLELPGAEESTTYGSPSLKLGGKMFACIASHKDAEPGTLAVRMSFEQRDELIAAEPASYYTKDHYLHYPCVLVRLHRVDRDALRDVLRMGWRFVSASTVRASRAKLRGR